MNDSDDNIDEIGIEYSDNYNDNCDSVYNEQNIDESSSNYSKSGKGDEVNVDYKSQDVSENSEKNKDGLVFESGSIPSTKRIGNDVPDQEYKLNDEHYLKSETSNSEILKKKFNSKIVTESKQAEDLNKNKAEDMDCTANHNNQQTNFPEIHSPNGINNQQAVIGDYAKNRLIKIYADESNNSIFKKELLKCPIGHKNLIIFRWNTNQSIFESLENVENENIVKEAKFCRQFHNINSKCKNIQYCNVINLKSRINYFSCLMASVIWLATQSIMLIQGFFRSQFSDLSYQIILSAVLLLGIILTLILWIFYHRLFKKRLMVRMERIKNILEKVNFSPYFKEKGQVFSIGNLGAWIELRIPEAAPILTNKNCKISNKKKLTNKKELKIEECDRSGNQIIKIKPIKAFTRFDENLQNSNSKTDVNVVKKQRESVAVVENSLSTVISGNIINIKAKTKQSSPIKISRQQSPIKISKQSSPIKISKQSQKHQLKTQQGEGAEPKDLNSEILMVAFGEVKPESNSQKPNRKTAGNAPESGRHMKKSRLDNVNIAIIESSSYENSGECEKRRSCENSDGQSNSNKSNKNPNLDNDSANKSI